MLRGVLVSVVLVALVPGLAMADISSTVYPITPVSYTANGGASAWSENFTQWYKTLTFPQFNPALGTLHSVTLRVNAQMTTVITVQNDPEQGQYTSGYAYTDFQFFVDDYNLGGGPVRPRVH
jgi:hypothetical protein